MPVTFKKMQREFTPFQRSYKENYSVQADKATHIRSIYR